MDKFKREKKLGEGAFGSVHLCRRENADELVVQKEVNLTALKERELTILLDKVDVLKHFNEFPHPNVVKWDGFLRVNDILVIHMEYCEAGSLADDIAGRQQGGEHYDDRTIVEYIRQIAAGLAHLHGHHVIHRDLKPANILISGDQVLKLADFGLDALLSGDLQHTCTSMYMAPEVISEEAYDPSCDIWSFGAVIYELIALKPAFVVRSLAATMRNILAGKFASLESPCSEPLRDLVASMLQVEAKRRPKCSGILALNLIRKEEIDTSPTEAVERAMSDEDVSSRNPESQSAVGQSPVSESEGCNRVSSETDMQDSNTSDEPVAARRPEEDPEAVKEWEKWKMTFESHRFKDEKYTLLHYVCAKGATPVVRLLLQRGVDCNAKCTDGFTPLHYATRIGQLEVAKILLDHSANVNQIDNRRETPLHYACHYGWSELARQLQQRGAH